MAKTEDQRLPMASRFPKIIAFDLECVLNAWTFLKPLAKVYAVILFGHCGSIPLLVVCLVYWSFGQLLSQFLLLAKRLVYTHSIPEA